MRTQLRWRCKECRREWIYRTSGPEGNCPGCGSPEIERVQFKGLFDIDTPYESYLNHGVPDGTAARSNENEAVPPPLSLVKS